MRNNGHKHTHYLVQPSVLSFFLCLFFVTLFADPAHAIPSPELVIGSISSISQMVALVSAMLGGGAAAVGFRSSLKGGEQPQNSKIFLRIAGILFLIAFSSVGLNIYQYFKHDSESLARMQATLIRPAKAQGTKILDPNLKETSLSKQASHPLGIATEEAQKWLDKAQANDNSTLFIDAREDGENEMGTLPGSRHIRFPDLATASIDYKGSTVVLFCHNGNRSSESCEKLAKLGIDCRFITGGIEKWIVEGRPFSNNSVRGLEDLRAIPPYLAQNTLLSTSQVHELVNNKAAQFVDVRYPGEFKLAHLPGAINIPLRATSTEKLRDMINALPKKPIIAACYDRRGCFISQVLGLELVRAGHKFRGRYTLPWEYFVPPKPKPHIAAWMASNQRGLWQSAVAVVAGFVSIIANSTNYLVAIILLATLSRLLVLPISLKAERDQVITNHTSDQLKALKERLKDDPKRQSRAIQEFYRDKGLTPLRNMLSLAFLPIMALGLSAVQQAAANNPTPLLWFADISKPGPYFLLPTLFAVLASVYLQSAVAKTGRQKLFSWIIGFPLFTALALMFNAAGGLYLVIALLLLLVQRAYVTGKFNIISTLWKALVGSINQYRYRDGIIPLSQTDLLVGCGNKSYRLSRLMEIDIAVPDGVVLNSRFLQEFLRASVPARKKSLAKIWRLVNASEVAVRSSASAEDGELQSFAGVFDSKLNIGRDELEDAILAVAASFTSDRAASYGGNDNNLDDGNILVQSMVDADYAGVLFTRDPEAPGLMMAEVVEGTADALVSGMAVPALCRFGRFSHQPAENNAPSIDLTPLLEIGMRAEKLFGTPQDIEWTYRGRKFQIVQSRDITTIHNGNIKEQMRWSEWKKMLRRANLAPPQETAFEQNEMSEVLPRPTPLSLQLMQSLWASGGSVDHACRRLGLSYDIGEASTPSFTTIFGRLYTDVQIARKNAVTVTSRCAANFTKNGEQIATRFRDEFLPRFNEEMVLLESANFDRLPQDELSKLTARLWHEFITITHVEVEIINIAAAFHMQTATLEIESAGLDPAALLGTTADAGPANIIAKAAKLPKAMRRSLLLNEMGHRSTFDYELSEPRYQEQPEKLDAICSDPHVAIAKTGHSSKPAWDQSHSTTKCAKLHLAKVYQSLKEDAKHQSLRHLAILRKLIMATDRHHNLQGLSFYLTLDEILAIAECDIGEVRTKAQQRRDHQQQLLDFPPVASSLSLVEIEHASSNIAGTMTHNDGLLHGTRVAGSDAVQGKACVVSRADCELGVPLENFIDGDIIVCAMVHPAWLPQVLRSGGVVCEVGGWLSHIAIVAREHNVPMIVGVKGLAAIDQDCELVLDPDGSVEVLTEDEREIPTQAAE